MAGTSKELQKRTAFRAKLDINLVLLLPFLAYETRLFYISNASFVLHEEEHYLANVLEMLPYDDLARLLTITLRILQGPHNFGH